MLSLGLVASQLRSYDDASLQLLLDANRLDSYPGSGTTWFDISGNARNATLVNAPVTSSGPKAITFNGVGSTSYAWLAHNAAFDLQGPSTVSYWMRATTNVEGGFIEKGYYTGNGGWMHWWVSNEHRYYIRKVSRLSNGGLTTGVWWHLATTIDGTTIKMTANGLPFLTAAYSGYSEPNTEIVNIGRYSPAQYFYGLMNGIRIHNRALPIEEIKAIYDDEKALYGL